MLITVPRVLEKIQAVLEEQLDSAAGDRRKLLAWARDVSTRHHNSLLSGGPGGREEYRLAKKLVLDKIHRRLGLDRCLRGVYSGLSPVNSATVDYLKSVGLLVREIYGTTENPSHTANVYDPETEDVAGIRLGSVGRSNPGTETRLRQVEEGVEEGEITAY